jgi:hypothetical protein
MVTRRAAVQARAQQTREARIDWPTLNRTTFATLCELLGEFTLHRPDVLRRR